MAFIITHDHINAGDDRRVGTIGPRRANPKNVTLLLEGGGHRFRLIDDDNCLCYQGRSTADDSFTPLDCFGTPDAGCTIIQYWTTGKGGGWSTL